MNQTEQMYLKYTRKPGMAARLYHKIWLIMRLTTVILLFTLMQVSAATFGQRITLDKKNVPLTSVLKEIRRQSGYDILFDGKVLNNQQVSVKVSDASLEEALKRTLNGLPFTFEVGEKSVNIFKSEKRLVVESVVNVSIMDVRGKVVDTLGTPLAGATVIVKGGKKSTSTAANGDFYLRNVPEDAILQVSFLGYVTREMKADSEFNYIQLKQSSSKLDEVQVIAYGTTTQRLSTSNVTMIKASEIAKQPVTNPLYALQGRVPGLEVMPTTGLSGGAVNLQIRGRNSLYNQSEPLILVDGIPTPTNIAGLGFNGINLQQLSSLSFINPSDIESISVLRDADATSIYGSRGANGVILITTKRGRAGDAKLNVRFQQGASDMNRRMEMMNTQDYLKLRKEAISNSGIDLNSAPWNLDIYKRIFFADVTQWNQTAFTDWQDEMLGGVGSFTDFQGSIVGGVPQVIYTLGGNYHRETTIFRGDNSDQRGSVHFSLTGLSKDNKLQATLTGSYQLNKNTLPGIDFTETALRLPPNAPALLTQDGLLNWELTPSGVSSWDNPYAELFKTYEAKTNNLISNIDLIYRPINSLTFKIQGGYNKLDASAFIKFRPIASLPPELPARDAAAAFNRSQSENINVEPQITYNQNFGRHNFSLLSGASFQYSKLAAESITGNGALSDALLRNLSSYTAIYASNSSSEYKYAALFGRLSYNYDSRYLLNISLRRDGSSRFGPGRRFGTFSSIGGAWILSDETFMSGLKSIFSFIKLRASFGSSGNDGIGDYRYLESYSMPFYSRPYQNTPSSLNNGIFNEQYSWESTRKLEGGLDVGLLGDRVTASLSAYRNRSNNQLLTYPNPSMVGPGGAVINLPALIQNQGIEIALRSEIIKAKNFSWATSVNVSRNRNKLLDYPNYENSAYFDAAIGRPFFGELFTFVHTPTVDPTTGRYKFVNSNGSVVDDPSEPSDARYGQYNPVNTVPSFFGGISNTLTYKNISLDFLVQFTKQYGRNPISDFINQAGRLGNVPAVFNDRWQKPGDVATFQKMFDLIIPDDYRLTREQYGASDLQYVDASFIRLKNVSLSYSLPEKIIKRIGLSEFRLFTQAQNLLTITPYKGLDPETQSIYSLPPLRTIVAGLQVTF